MQNRRVFRQHFIQVSKKLLDHFLSFFDREPFYSEEQTKYQIERSRDWCHGKDNERGFWVVLRKKKNAPSLLSLSNSNSSSSSTRKEEKEELLKYIRDQEIILRTLQTEISATQKLMEQTHAMLQRLESKSGH